MATGDVVRTITIRGVADNLDETATAAKKVGDAISGVGVASDTMSKSTLSVQSALDRQQRSLDAVYRAQQQFSSSQKVINEAQGQGLISQDRANQLLDLAAQRMANVGKATSPVATAVQQVQTQMVALAAGAGPVGVFLASFGPLGLAAAAGITLITQAIEAAAREADRLGDLSRTLREVAESANLTTTQVQALQIAGAAVGLDSQQIATGFEKFNTQLAQLKDGSGNLLTILDRINPSLALQLSATRDAATAWNILATAYANADRNQQALIQHAIAGNRGGAGVGRLLGATAAGGGVGGLQSAIAPADIIPPETVQRLANLKTEIDQIKQSTANIWASIYSPSIQAEQKQAAEYMHDLAVAAKELADAGANSSWLRFVNLIGGQGATGAGTGVVNRSAAGLIDEQTGRGNVAYPPPLSSDLIPPAGQPSAATQATQLKTLIEFLGPAATASDQLRQKTLELKAALDANTITQTTYNRAVAGLNLQTAIQLESQRIALLGQAATVEDIAKQKQDEINAARLRGVQISGPEAQGIIAAAQALKQAQDQAILTTNNVATAEGLRASKLAELNALVLQGKLTQDQANVSLQASVIANEKVVQQQQIAVAALPQLKQLELQAGDVRYQFDTFATTTTQSVGSPLADISTGDEDAIEEGNLA